jgi:hypothetical protein
VGCEEALGCSPTETESCEAEGTSSLVRFTVGCEEALGCSTISRLTESTDSSSEARLRVDLGRLLLERASADALAVVLVFMAALELNGIQKIASINSELRMQ